MATLEELEARLNNLLSTAQVETKDIDLFAPIEEKEECPICLLPLPTKNKETHFMSCCGKYVCNGCTYREALNDLKSGKSKHTLINERKCAFCRQPCILSGTKQIKSLRKLMKKKNPEAFMMMAAAYRSGDGVFQSDTKSLEMSIQAAELGHANAFAVIAIYHINGTLGLEQNISKALEYQEVAAKKGSIGAHYDLAIRHRRYGNIELCIKHLKVIASAGDQKSRIV